MNCSNPAYNSLIEELEHFYPACSTALKIELKKKLFEIDLKKGKRLLNYKEIQESAYFIYKGSAIEFWVNPITLEETASKFWFEKDFLYTTPGLFSREPSLSAIELMEDTRLVGMPFADFITMKITFPELEPLSENIRGNYGKLQQEHEADLHLSAIYRVQKLEAEHPNIYNLAEMRHIAQYLKINPETLRRLRGK
ncbi:cyclic nucleotide-binding domain-containing protein [Pedobacter nyackensis]|uniref:cAMP-binding domain of CRP or a regulatory subunit of cAMP-dependent protein kinases n=1 Tax=Pedobacter nyackensis TaxID=475255 RepID=A0A1W2EFM2_9SPHI|nr:Crp/Fnr family transcriptional regulator [Pedobacter nyackensis]SMD08503.1 cAMP-binding domain of CRP or a regulatory subunit of cAMP-dependent protein kinases [Pedobacter nyackensis]